MKTMMTTVAAMVLGSLAARFSAADSAAGAGDSPPAAADKSVYNFFNPTPAGQLRDMDTDRPNKSNTPHTVDAGHFQLETGLLDFLHFRDRSSGNNARNDNLALGQFNLRVGVLNNLELNAAFEAYDFNRNHDLAAAQSSRQNGHGDLIVGGKLNLWGNDGADAAWAAGLAIQPQIKIPTARQELGNGHPELAIGLPFVMNLPENFHLGLQTTGLWIRSADNTGAVAGWQNSISLDRVFFDKADFYLEYWSQVTTERHRKSQGTVDLGVVYQLTANMSLDSGVNLGVNNASPTLELFLGMTIRY